MAHAGNGYQLPDDPGAGFNGNPDHGNDGVGDEDIELPEGEANDNLGLGAGHDEVPHFPPRRPLSKMGRAYPADDSDPGAFSCNPDAKIFGLSLEDPMNLDEEVGMLTEGNCDGNNEFCHESMMTSD